MVVWLDNPPDGTVIAAGFDGSETDDFTCIKCITVDSAFLFTLRYSVDALPSFWNPAQFNGNIPRGEVHACVDEMFSRFVVKRFYCDPQGYYSEIAAWNLDYGAAVMEFPTNKVTRMFPAIKRFETDLREGAFTHDGCETTSLHVANARKVHKPGQQYLLGKPTHHQKIDLAMASILAYEARADALAAGVNLKKSNSDKSLIQFD